MFISRRRFSTSAMLGVAAVLWPARAWVGEMRVPVQLQVNLSAKVMEYVQQPRVREASTIKIGILIKANNAESERVGMELKVAFDRISIIAGRPHEQTIVQWSNARELVERLKEEKFLLVYLTPGMDNDIPTIVETLPGLQIVTISAIDSFVRRGALLGFEIVSGHPKMIFNLTQAKKQGVVLGSAVLRLMRIVE